MEKRMRDSAVWLILAASIFLCVTALLNTSHAGRVEANAGAGASELIVLQLRNEKILMVDQKNQIMCVYDEFSSRDGGLRLITARKFDGDVNILTELKPNPQTRGYSYAEARKAIEKLKEKLHRN